MGEQANLKQVESLIHKTYYLRQSTTDVVLRAEYEEKLRHLFELKMKLEEKHDGVQIIARISKRHIKDLQTAVLIVRRKLGMKREADKKLHTEMEPVAN